MVHGKEHCLYHIEHIDERQHLGLVTNGEIDVLTNAFSHHEIVALARTIDSRRSQYDIGQVLDSGKIVFSGELALSVFCIKYIVPLSAPICNP